MVTWNAIGLRYGIDKATTGPRDGLGHGYLEHYERILAGHDVGSLLEIGVQSGQSLHLWAELFPGAQIVGVDTDPACAGLPGPFEVLIGDAGDPEAMAPLLDRTFDVIIDDGSHLLRETEQNTAVWASHLAPGGIYVVEDCAFGSTSWVQSVEDVLAMLLRYGLTPLAANRSLMRWVAHDHYGGMMAIVFADARCEIPCAP